MSKKFGVNHIHHNKEEKPRFPASNLAIIAIYVFSQEIFKAIERVSVSDEAEIGSTNAIKDLVDRGASVYALELIRRERRINIGTPESYWNALKTLQKPFDSHLNMHSSEPVSLRLQTIEASLDQQCLEASQRAPKSERTGQILPDHLFGVAKLFRCFRFLSKYHISHVIMKVGRTSALGANSNKETSPTQRKMTTQTKIPTTSNASPTPGIVNTAATYSTMSSITQNISERSSMSVKTKYRGTRILLVVFPG